MQLLLLFGKHLFVALSSLRKLFTMPLIHILQYLLKLFDLKVSFISFQKHSIQLFFILIYQPANTLFSASEWSYLGLVGFAHFKSLLEISLDLLVLSLESPQAIFGRLEFFLHNHQSIKSFLFSLYGVVCLAFKRIHLDRDPFILFSAHFLMSE